MTPHDAPSTPTNESAPPAFLTVEEAAVVLRIGRTAAYALTRQWRATGGAEGLPVVRFGRLLRVPVHELERLASGTIDLTIAPPELTSDPVSSAPPSRPPATPTPDPSPTSRRIQAKPPQGQPSLFPEAS